MWGLSGRTGSLVGGAGGGQNPNGTLNSLEQPGRKVAVRKRRLASWRGPRPQSVEDGCLGKF